MAVLMTWTKIEKVALPKNRSISDSMIGKSFRESFVHIL